MEMPTTQAQPEEPALAKMSKRKRKKIQKQKRWLEQKDEILRLRREKRKQKKLERRNRQKATNLEAKKTGTYIPRPNNKKLKQIATEKIKSSPILIIDSSYEDKLDPKSLNSLLKQYSHLNALMKKNDRIFRVEISGIGAETKSILKTKYADKWIIPCFEQDYIQKLSDQPELDCWGNRLEPYECPSQSFPMAVKERLVYLSGDASEDMDALDDR